VGSKLNGALAFYILGIVYVLAFFRLISKRQVIENKKDYFKKWFISGTISVVLGLGLFLFFNPQMQVSPVKMTKTIQSSADAYFEKRAKKFCEDQLKPNLDSTFLIIKYLYDTRSVSPEVFNSLNGKYSQLINEVKAAFQKEDFFRNKKKTDRLIAQYNATVSEIVSYKKDSQIKPLEFINWVYLKNNFYESAQLVNERIG